MAGNLFRTKDDIYYTVPEGVDPYGPEAKQIVAAERAGRARRRMQTPEMQAKVAATREQMRGELDPTEGMSGLDKTLANVGAGMANTWEGAKQIFGQGSSDEDIEEKRAIDKQLAEKTDLGIGPSWAPTAGSALQ